MNSNFANKIRDLRQVLINSVLPRYQVESGGEISLIQIPLLKYIVITLLITILVFHLFGEHVIRDSSHLQPQGAIYNWEPFLLGIHLVADIFIGLSYLGITLALIYLAKKVGKSLPFLWTFIAFGIFIVACGFTHLMAAWTVWQPVHWIAGGVKVVTAVASVGTAIAMPPLIPRVLALVSTAQLSENRKKRLESANLELKRSNDELDHFASIASHDLREPLRKVQTFGKVLKDKYSSEIPEEGKEYIDRMLHATTRMDSLIQGLLTYSRITTHAREFEKIDLNQIVEEVLSDIETRIAETEARLEIGKLSSIYGDPLQIRQLFQNLLSNAIKFHEKGSIPVVKIYEKKTDSMAQIFIEDNGIGFDEKHLDRIFCVFERLHTNKEYEGTGLGLAVCKKIVERHGGNITAESKVGEGTRFIVSMPFSAGSVKFN
jgi:signal transduction histidine kinase